MQIDVDPTDTLVQLSAEEARLLGNAQNSIGNFQRRLAPGPMLTNDVRITVDPNVIARHYVQRRILFKPAPNHFDSPWKQNIVRVKPPQHIPTRPRKSLAQRVALTAI